MSRLFQSALGLLLSGFALYYFVLVSPSNIGNAFADQMHIIALLCILLVPVYGLRAVKLYFIMRRQNVSFLKLAGSQFAGVALNNVLPFRLGDVLRTGYQIRYLNIRFSAAIVALIVERIFDLCAILILFLSFMILVYFELVTLLLSSYLNIILGILLLIGMFFIFGLMHKKVREKVSFLWLRALNYWPMSTKDTLKVGSLAIIQWIIEIVCLGLVLSYVLFGTVEPVALLSTFLSNLSTLVPSAPGYVGTFEAAGIFPFYHSSFADMKSASIFVLLLHSSIWIFSTVLGCLSLAFLPESLKILFDGNNKGK